jgi:transitional endoplasmic reticulum ATPase
MVGSTNYLDRLDPGISKRPSRFDRKYFFPNPNLEERTLYAEFWRNKLLRGEKTEDSNSGCCSCGDEDVQSTNLNDPVEFPEKLCEAIAGITKGFSFAYMQEAFVAALLAIAADENGKLNDISQSFELVTMDDFDLGTSEEDGDKDLDKYVLWREIKRQIKILRKDLEESGDSES